MKKFFLLGAIAIAGMTTQSAQAQSILSNLLSGVARSASATATQQNTTTPQTPSSTAKDILGGALNGVVANNGTDNELLSYLISSVTGDITTTATTVVGTWSYTNPSVQFETENYLSQAGGAAIAEKVQSKLASLYKLVGIKQGTLIFTFEANGSMTYAVGRISREATYTFDSANKTITITTAAGANIRCFVTVSGNNMLLTFDGAKFLTFMKTLGSKFSALSTVATLANSYDGMKVGFAFEKK